MVDILIVQLGIQVFPLEHIVLVAQDVAGSCGSQIEDYVSLLVREVIAHAPLLVNELLLLRGVRGKGGLTFW